MKCFVPEREKSRLNSARVKTIFTKLLYFEISIKRNFSIINSLLNNEYGIVLSFQMILNSLLIYDKRNKMKNIFKMKINVLASLVVITGGMLSNLSMANAYDGKITFSGKISDATCEITGGNTNGTESSDPSFTVTLPKVSTTAFKKAGNRAGDTNFYIKLKGNNCEAGDGYAIKFEKILSNEFIDPITGNLKNIHPNGADNIQLVISEDNKDFNFSTNIDTSKTKKRTNVEDETIFNFGVQYISTKDNVTGGDVEGNIFYSVVYP